MNVAAYAQESADDNITLRNLEKPLPNIPVLSKEELIKQFKFIEEKRPGEDPYSGFVIFVPKTWVEAPPGLVKNFSQGGGKLIGDIAKYYSDLNAPVKSSITVEAHALQSNISAKNWLVNYLIDYGYLIEGIEGEGRQKAEAVATLYNVGSVDYRSRIVAHINGDRVLLANYMVPVPFWDQEKNYQATALKTFNLIQKDTATLYQTLTFDLNGWAEFDYPDAWYTMLPDTKGYDRVSVNLARFERSFYDTEEEALQARKRQTLLSSGLMNVRLVWFENLDTTLVDEINLVKESFDKRGYKVTSSLEKHDISLDFPPETTVRNFEMYKVRYEKQREEGFELWIASMKYEEFYFIVSMLVANKDEQYLKWIENKSAYELVVSSIRLISQYDY